MTVRIASADVAYINQKEEAAVGTYHYPVNQNGQFTPGYFFVPAETDIDFTLIAQDGATLHVFNDAAGTTELVVPADLRTVGQVQSSLDGSDYHQGTVHLTQGWHKLYVDYTLLSLRADTNDCYCRLKFSIGQLYNQPQAVSAQSSFNDWTGTPTSASTGTVTFTLADGVTPAAGDHLTWSIAKVSTDAAGNNPVSVSYASVTGDAATDANGVANATITWYIPNTTPCQIQYYVWLGVTDNSQPALPLPSAATQSNFQQFSNIGVQPAMYYYPLPVLFAPCDPNGGGGGGGGGGTPKPYPVKVVSLKRLSNTRLPNATNPLMWGHIDRWQLQVRDQNNNPFQNGYPIEKFNNVTKTTDKKLLKEGDIRNAPGSPGAWQQGATFVDTNQSHISYNSGATTWWYTFDQQWFCAVTDSPAKLYTLNIHTVRHEQAQTFRTVH